MKKSPHQLRKKKSDDKLRIDFHEPKPIETGIGSPDTWYFGMIKPVATGVNELPQSRIPSLIFLVVGYHKPFLFDVSGLTPHAHLRATLSYFEDEGRLYRGLRMEKQKWWS